MTLWQYSGNIVWSDRQWEQAQLKLLDEKGNKKFLNLEVPSKNAFKFGTLEFYVIRIMLSEMLVKVLAKFGTDKISLF